MSPEIFTDEDGNISSGCLPGEVSEANRGIPVNSAFAAAAYLMGQEPDAAVEVLSRSDNLGMPKRLAELLVQAALQKKIFSVRFTTVFGETIGSIRKRTYSGFTIK